MPTVTLRHSAAGVLLTHGVPLEDVSETLGHSSSAITDDVYGTSRPCEAPSSSSAGKSGLVVKKLL